MLALSCTSFAEFSQNGSFYPFSSDVSWQAASNLCETKRGGADLQLKRLSNGILGITLAGGDVILSDNLPVSGQPPLGFTY